MNGKNKSPPDWILTWCPGSQPVSRRNLLRDRGSRLPGSPLALLPDVIEKDLSELRHDDDFRRIYLDIVEILETQHIPVMEFGNNSGKKEAQYLRRGGETGRSRITERQIQKLQSIF